MESTWISEYLKYFGKNSKHHVGLNSPPEQTRILCEESGKLARVPYKSQNRPSAINQAWIIRWCGYAEFKCFWPAQSAGASSRSAICRVNYRCIHTRMNARLAWIWSRLRLCRPAPQCIGILLRWWYFLLFPKSTLKQGLLFQWNVELLLRLYKHTCVIRGFRPAINSCMRRLLLPDLRKLVFLETRLYASISQLALGMCITGMTIKRVTWHCQWQHTSWLYR